MQTGSNHNPDKDFNYDFACINPGLNKLLYALQELRNTRKVILIFEGDLERTDHFDYTRTFPFHLYEISSLKRNFSTLQQVIQMAPHLFQPEKVLYIEPNRTSKFAASLADNLYKNAYQRKLNILVPEQVEQLAFLENKSTKGIYFQEYKLNTSRLFTELLKYFQAEAGTVKVHSPVKRNQNKLTFVSSGQTLTAANISAGSHEKKTHYLLPLKMPANFSMVYRDSTWAFRFSEHHKKALAEPLNKASEKASVQSFITFARALFQPKIEEVTTLEITASPTLEELKKLAEIIDRPLSCTFEETSLEDIYERCLEKFDLAKQTGISYADFKIIFHRYGKAIDEMTEDAYTLMNEFRDPEKIWNLAEKNVQKKYEWGI